MSLYRCIGLVNSTNNFPSRASRLTAGISRLPESRKRRRGFNLQAFSVKKKDLNVEGREKKNGAYIKFLVVSGN